MGAPAVPQMIDTELEAFAELARNLTRDQWQAPSLCTEWTVQEVVTHVAYHTHRAGLRQIVFPKWEQRLIAENRADTIEGLVAWLGSRPADSARKSTVNLAEVVIHQQDVRRPLNAPRDYPEETLRACLDYCTTATGNLLVTGVRHRCGRELTLRATDLDWSSGQGPEVIGSGESLLMAITGRGAALSDLSGDGVHALAERIYATARVSAA